MTISWANSDGQTGIAEDAYEFAMQHSNTEAKSDKSTPQVNSSTKGDREELAPQDRINQAFGEGPAAPEIKDQNAPYSWGMGEDLKGLGTLPDAPDEEWEKSYGPKPTMREGTVLEQFASFQKRLDATPPEEAGAFRKFLGSLNIMPAPGKPESEWTAKEHFGVLLNTAMVGMGAGWRGPGIVSPGNFKTALSKAGPAANMNRESYQINPTPYEEAQLEASWKALGKDLSKPDLKAIEGGKGLTTETEPQLQQAQDQRVNWPEGWGVTKATGRALTEYPHVQKAFKEAVESGAKTTAEITDHMNLNGTAINPSTVQLLKSKAGLTGTKAEAWSTDKNDTFMKLISEGKTTPEIAKEMGITRSTVEGKLSRIKENNPDFERTFVPRETMATRLDSVRELAKQGLHANAIAEKIGKSSAYVRMLASTGDIELPRDPNSRGGGALKKAEKGAWQKAIQDRLNQ